MSVEDEGLVFDVPPAGPTRGLLVEAFPGVLLAAVAFLRGMVADSVVPTPFFLVFPLAGLAYLLPSLYRMALRERIRLGLKEGEIERSLGAWRWQVPFRIGELKVEVEEGLFSGRGKLTLESRCSAQYVEVQRLLAGHDLVEQRWVAASIEEWIRSTNPGS
jgi:hypothetical protein